MNLLREFLFQTDWNDGRALCGLVKSLGMPAKYEESDDPAVWLSNLNAGKYFFFTSIIFVNPRVLL